MADAPILVTGGAGFIGSHACKALSLAGFLPVVIDNLCTGHGDSVKWGPFYELDVRNSLAVADVISRHDIRHVMHFAASAYVGESVRNPGKYYQNNIGGMQALLDACVTAKVENLIFSSSCATYGIPESQPIREDSPQNPINPYGRTKLIGEQMIRDYAHAYGIKYATLRYFNACGADPDGELAERHDPETHLLPLAMLAAAGLHDELQIFGTDYATQDGTCVRDYIHVDDLAHGHVAALQHLLDGGASLALNLGSGKGHSVLQVLEEIENVTGRKVPARFAARRPGDPPVLTADPSLAAEVLGFHTLHSSMAQIIRDAAPFFGLSKKEAQNA
ncbi:UDP-glucose 4-epimerase [Actibacterium mucosum KCTC 23349]|uniref:UDP-glucose 4-epimerase n=1 Tax=Actibacterium mucosum KCTC 23349 TaxID=1454373 RepID=A0A037ZJH2_9RHOB|nr:UDP-glucose 4-epimerase GalE [Actibacterium mucosum]KAJ54946.1 UDP-glucose 4-epimerase [Actibacterium mucosum KCTC 23349]